MNQPNNRSSNQSKISTIGMHNQRNESWKTAVMANAFVLAMLLTVSACGTEGGNPHQPTPDASADKCGKEEPCTASGQTDVPEGDLGRTPSKSDPAGIEKPPNCTLELSTGAAPGFQFEFAPQPGNGTPTPPALSRVFASLKRSTGSSAPTDETTRPIAEWTPAPGEWSLTINITPEETDPESPSKAYCQVIFTLPEGTTASSAVLVKVTGTQ